MARGWLYFGALVTLSGWLARDAQACPAAGERQHFAEVELNGKAFAEAERDYKIIAEACPDEAAAWRTLGRVAGANADYSQGEAALAKANALANGAPDPELHFLRGEFLFELKRDAEATKEQDQALAEIGPAPTDRNYRLWLARILARRGNYIEADRWYAQIETDAGPKGDDEVSMTRSENLMRANDVPRAIDVLRRVYDRGSRSIRVLELLAWAYEITGDIEMELKVRTMVVELKPKEWRAHADFARVLERFGDKRMALAEYTKARDIQDNPEIDIAYERLRHQLSPEVLLGLSGYAEPYATALRLVAGGSFSAANNIQLGLLGWVEGGTSNRERNDRPQSISEGAVAFVGMNLSDGLDVRGALTYRHGSLPRFDVATGQFVFLARDTVGADVSAVGQIGEGRVTVEGSFHQPWSDAAIAVVEGGDQTGVELHAAYPILDGRLVLDGAGLGRLLELSRELDGTIPHASHLAWSVGPDVVLWRHPEGRLHGEVLDERLDRSVYLQDALVVGFRHYDAYVHTEDAFMLRIDIAPRVSLDMAIATLRKVMFHGQLGVELRGVLGYDRAREASVEGIGLSAYLASWAGGRFVLQGEVASESAGVLLGRRTWSLLSYHHDLL